jgi:3'-phosphoadenosine 5'-phosphosulfate sulfotransferase (PAPS reductase)/FAD synthetase
MGRMSRDKGKRGESVLEGGVSDPFRIEGPALISFSGGRTSAFMLWKIVQTWGGELPADVVTIFTNTGKEAEQTLEFVRDCGERWGVDIVWLEYQDADAVPDRWKVVTFNSASRKGEPFSALIGRKKAVPNPVQRWCTQELKIRPMDKYAERLGWDDYDVVLGLRADEPMRVAKMRGTNRLMPLAQAGTAKADVQAFWRAQNFDLGLPSINGVTPAGNCDLCFLKGMATTQGLIRANPELADWWIAQEARVGATFHKDRPSYAALKDAVERQHEFDFGDDSQLIDCFCGEAA